MSGQLKGVVVKQKLFRPTIQEGSVHGSVNISCPRFFFLLNMDDVDGFTLWWLLSLKVAEGFVDWVSCWTCGLNNSRSAACDHCDSPCMCIYLVIWFPFQKQKKYIKQRVVIMIFVQNN